VASGGINNRTSAYQILGVPTGIYQTRGHMTARYAGYAYVAAPYTMARTNATATANFCFTTRFGVAMVAGTLRNVTRLGGAGSNSDSRYPRPG